MSGKLPTSSTARAYFPPSATPMETFAVIVKSPRRMFFCLAKWPRALLKQAAYPAPKSCSGFVPVPPGPPSDFGEES